MWGWAEQEVEAVQDLLSHYAKCHEMPFCMRGFYRERGESVEAGEGVERRGGGGEVEGVRARKVEETC